MYSDNMAWNGTIEGKSWLGSLDVVKQEGSRRKAIRIQKTNCRKQIPQRIFQK